LLCLVEGDKHGYAIMKEVDARTDRQLRLGPGTLYGCIQRMIAAGLIRERNDLRPAPGELERRRYYSITPYGKQIAALEARRLSGLVHLAHKLRLIPRMT
jgi:DNA-binding PadR family transcriptional regulator